MSNMDEKVFWSLVALFAIQVVWFYPKLPQVVAIHFDLAGRADGWSGKQWFFWSYLGVAALAMAPFVGLRYWADKIPSRFIHIPNRDYWLSPENREHTLQKLSSRVLWFGNATLFLFISMFHFTYLANTGPEKRLPLVFWVIIVVYIVISIIWSLSFVWPFRKGGPKQ